MLLGNKIDLKESVIEYIYFHLTVNANDDDYSQVSYLLILTYYLHCQINFQKLVLIQDVIEYSCNALLMLRKTPHRYVMLKKQYISSYLFDYVFRIALYLISSSALLK